MRGLHGGRDRSLASHTVTMVTALPRSTISEGQWDSKPSAERTAVDGSMGAVVAGVGSPMGAIRSTRCPCDSKFLYLDCRRSCRPRHQLRSPPPNSVLCGAARKGPQPRLTASPQTASRRPPPATGCMVAPADTRPGCVCTRTGAGNKNGIENWGAEVIHTKRDAIIFARRLRSMLALLWVLSHRRPPRHPRCCTRHLQQEGHRSQRQGP